jgi:hypothetical protein
MHDIQACPMPRAPAPSRKRIPGTAELAYDNYNALAIGFGPDEKTSNAVISVAVWPRSVMLYFLKGATLTIRKAS